MEKCGPQFGPYEDSRRLISQCHLAREGAKLFSVASHCFGYNQKNAQRNRDTEAQRIRSNETREISVAVLKKNAQHT
jgi:hypothetical protein